jgi:hypothetical protein
VGDHATLRRHARRGDGALNTISLPLGDRAPGDSAPIIAIVPDGTRAVHVEFVNRSGATQARREHDVRGQFVNVTPASKRSRRLSSADRSPNRSP